MEFVSTRGGMEPANFSDILLEGLAPDGGLVVPKEIPRVEQDEIESWRGLAYPQLAAKVIGKLWTDIDIADLEGICERAYGSQFSGDIVPLRKVDEQITLVGLSEGPTLAFKDMAMQFLGEAIPYVLTKRGQTLNILGATSGDTGSAAEYAFRSQPNVAVFMLSPQGRMSEFQRAQMYSLPDENIHNIAVEGVFDDCQNMVKELNGDLKFKAANTLGTVNSINLGRVAAQVAYYFWAWLRATDALDETGRAEFEAAFSVPSGNFGNIFSGHLAKQMGLPVRRLLLATNENNVLDEFFRTGVYRPRNRENTLATSSPSMDISKASNLERFVYHLLGSDAHRLREAWEKLDATGSLDLSAELDRFIGEFGIVSGKSTHNDRLAAITWVHETNGEIIDPHTADGVTVARELAEPDENVLVLETAKPQKFADTVIEALGFEAPVGEELADLLGRPQRTVDMADDSQVLRDYIAEHAVR
ncbi:MAG TPA: threonine synthase [Dietzia timorensis]|uniref:Threonine synthase n=1 Tax=Dietzia timorensis TaxID=499555 RepID=A0A921F467_9ACTN|nr:threonine synthase [Dietzia timorensis]HJE91396.1 threonine synthase [Dietzia timorensis]